MKSYSEITGRYLKVQKKRTILTIIGIVLSVALITSIATMFKSFQDNKIRQVKENSGDFHILFKSVNGGHIPYFKAHNDIKKTGIVRYDGVSIIGKKSNRNVELYVESDNKEMLELKNIKLSEGRLPQKENEIILEPWAMEALNAKVGDKIALKLGEIIYPEDEGNGKEVNYEDIKFKEKNSKEYIICGLKEESMYGNGISYLSEESFLSKNEEYDIYANVNLKKQVETIGNQITEELNLTEDDIRYNEELLRLMLKSLDDSENKAIGLIAVFFIILVIAATVSVIYNSFHMSVMERVSQFGILRSVGASKNQIKRIVMKEAMILAIISIPIGLVLGLVALKIVIMILGSLAFSMFEGFEITINPIILLGSAVLGLITIYISSKGPAKLAAKVSPLEAIKNSGGVKKEYIKKTKSGIIAGKIFGVEGQVAYKNLRRNKIRFKITIFSMVISIVLFIVFNSFAYDIKKVEKVAMATEPEYRVMLGNDELEESTLSKFCEDIEKIQGVDLLHKEIRELPVIAIEKDKLNKDYENLTETSFYNFDEGDYAFSYSPFYAYNSKSFEKSKKNIIAGEINEKKLNEENGVIIIQNAHIKTKDKKRANIKVTNYKIGDEISIIPPSIAVDIDKNLLNHVGKIKVKVLGILEEDAVFEDSWEWGSLRFISTEKVYKDIFGELKSSNLNIRTGKDADHKVIKEKLETIANENNMYIFDNVEAAKRDKSMMIQIMVFIYGFITVVTLISSINIINTINTNLLLRKRELAILKSVGMEEKQIKKMIVLESIYYSIIASFYGILMGMPLSYILYKLMGELRAYEWNIPWSSMVMAFIGSIVIVIIASMISLRKMNKINIMDSIRAEE
ncbi:ABC transporter permease [Clostridium faecium]|uniref:ABC transporter permease n=1 Tax=Clostridium faecium TaxID=2762223 RepID=A0ABR8YPE7_9CLOT|nr:ABC transporter permease [Clostridium faecium]MBD8045893.1 ABC transporter permease [Clostridium faecium]